MKLFLDTEFNDFKGELISMAIISADGEEWYESLGCETPSKWVSDNVMPIINKAPISKLEMQKSLHQFLSIFKQVVIIADWPEDIKHFCDLLITGPGMRIDTPELIMCIRRDLDCSKSKIPHNALEDAKALREAFNNHEILQRKMLNSVSSLANLSSNTRQ